VSAHIYGRAIDIAALNGVAYTAFAVARLPLLGRYLFVAACMLAVFAGAGLLGWLGLPRDNPGRRPWTALGLAALAVVIVFFPLQQVDRLNVMKHDIAARDRIQADLRDLVTTPRVRAAIHACALVYVPSHRPIPLVSLWAGVRTNRIATPPAGQPPNGCVLAPASAEVAHLAVLDPNEPATSAAAYAGPALARNRSWVFATGG